MEEDRLHPDRVPAGLQYQQKKKAQEASTRFRTFVSVTSNEHNISPREGTCVTLRLCTGIGWNPMGSGVVGGMEAIRIAATALDVKPVCAPPTSRTTVLQALTRTGPPVALSSNASKVSSPAERAERREQRGKGRCMGPAISLDVLVQKCGVREEQKRKWPHEQALEVCTKFFCPQQSVLPLMKWTWCVPTMTCAV